MAVPFAVRPGQVWRSTRSAAEATSQKLITAIDDDGHALCRSVGLDEESGRASRIRVDRLRPACGYQLDFDPAAPDAPISEEILQVLAVAEKLFGPLLAAWQDDEEERLLAAFLADMFVMELSAREVPACSVIGWKQEPFVEQRRWHWCEAQGFILQLEGATVSARPASTVDDLVTERRVRLNQASFDRLLEESGQALKQTTLGPLLLSQLEQVAESFGAVIVGV